MNKKRISALCVATLFALLPLSAKAQVVINSTQGYTYTEPDPPKPKKELPYFRPTGPFVQLTAGLSNTAVLGYQASHSFMIAGGAGYNILSTEMRDEASIPLFAEVRLGTPRYVFSLFVDAKLGIDLNYIGRDSEFAPMGMLSAGMQFCNVAIGAGINLFKDFDINDGYYRSLTSTSALVYFEWRIPFTKLKGLFE